MATEYRVELANRPGALAEMGFALEEAGVNIDAIHGQECAGKSVFSFIPNNTATATTALANAGIPYTTREVLVVNVLDKPGSLAEVALVMAEANINIDAVYVMTDGYVIMAVDDLAGAIEVTKGMAVLEYRKN